MLGVIHKNLTGKKENTAFCIDGLFYTYGDLSREIGNIIALLRGRFNKPQKFIGVYAGDDILVYASILAIWFENHVFVPLNPGNPVTRNREIIRQADLDLILTAEALPQAYEGSGVDCILLSCSQVEQKEISPLESLPDDLRYLLFTSGSTGIPKGVPISCRNLDAFMDSMFTAGYDFDETDRFLQIYDLSFDGAFPAYLLPLCIGASVYTVPHNEIRYLLAIKLIREHKLTVIKMPPTVLVYLRPYFSEIDLPWVRYCIFGGEGLSLELVRAWSPCVSHSRILNVYGPTEGTIICTIYEWNREDTENAWKGILSIGKATGDTRILITGAGNRPLPAGTKGELCISGSQVTTGYRDDPVRNAEAFFIRKEKGVSRRYFRTGDLVFLNGKAMLMFCGRMDDQVQIDGFRVELGEIEKHARDFSPAVNISAVAHPTKDGVLRIHLFLEGRDEGINELRKYLEQRLPDYMMPFAIHAIAVFPRSSGGKISRTKLMESISKEDER